MFKICYLTLDDDEECTLHACITAKTSEGKWCYTDPDIKGVIGRILESKKLRVTGSSRFLKYHPGRLIEHLRDPSGHDSKQLEEKAKSRLGLETYLSRVEELHRQDIEREPSALTRIPAPFRETGKMHRQKICGILLSPDHRSTIYSGTNLIVAPNGEEYSVMEIKSMVKTMLNLTKRNHFQTRIIEQYVEIFRHDERHWLTTKVADMTKGEHRQKFCRKAIELFAQSGHPGARERILASTAQGALAPDDEDRDEDSEEEANAGEASDEDASDDENSDKEDSDDHYPSIATVTQGFGSINLGASVRPVGLQPRARGSGSGLAEPLARQNTHSSMHPTNVQTLPRQYQHAYLSNIPVYLHPSVQPYQISRINPQSSAYAQPQYQQPPSLGSNYQYAGYGDQQHPLPADNSELAQPQRPGYIIDRNDPRYGPPLSQQSAFASPYTQVPPQGRGSQRQLGQQQTEAKAIIKIGQDEFNSMTDYLGDRTKCSSPSWLNHNVEYYGAPGYAQGVRRTASPHATENYQAYLKITKAKRNPDPSPSSSSSSSSPSGGSGRPGPPQRRRLEDQEGQEKGEKGQRYAGTGQEKSKRDDRHAGGSQEKAKKGQGKEKKGSGGGGGRRG
ncbi:MAG: hypothetical protein ASARMPRED_005792 [Alectoria sarmentosa]|nr:MAG: hypothetical protein ASARMPRED_005792 [Alectoria sarmentosa]